MGRNLDRNQSTLQFEKYYRGCIWGLLPLQFLSFKKSMPHVKQKHVRASKPGLKTESNEPVSQLWKIQEKKFTSIIHEIGKVPKRQRLQRTHSIHRLEPPCICLDDSKYDLNHPVILHKKPIGSNETNYAVPHPRMCANVGMLDDEQELPDQAAVNEELSCETNVDMLDDEQELLDQAAVNEELSCETYDDFFDFFQIDKRLLLKSSHNPDTDDSAHSQGELNSHRRATFKRLGSFPMANKPSTGYGSLTPSKLTEVWPSSSSSSSASSFSFHCSENILLRSRSCTVPVNASGELANEKDNQYGTNQRALDYASDVRRYKLRRTRRASSSPESLERYTQLFETSFKKGAKLNISKSLKLSNENEVEFPLFDSGFMGKVQSMREALHAELPSDGIEFTKVQNKSRSSSIESEQPVSEVNKDEYFTGFERQLSSEPMLLDEQQMKSNFEKDSDALPPLCAEVTKTTATDKRDHFLQDGIPGSEDRVNFSYEQSVMNILEAFTAGNSLYISTEQSNELDEQLLSDIANEAIYDFYSIFDAYWPTPLCSSSNCHMHPPPNTEHITKKIQSRIQKLQNFSLKTGNSMDIVIAFDLAQEGGWMNLQAAAESIGLALDEMIFDELIEELVYE